MQKMKAVFRPASSSDLTRLNEISRAAKQHWDYPQQWMDHWEPELTIDEADLDRQIVMVVERKGRICGFCAVQEMKDYHEINHLWISPGCMGKGLGRALLQFTLKAAGMERGAVRVVSDPNAVSFYQKMGFETVDREESYPPGRFLPVMWMVGK